jgi:peptide/nickel transport system permease protein
MNRRSQSLGTLALLHGIVLLAPLLAPYDAAEQHRDYPNAPPTRVHIIDVDGRWTWRPFVCALAPSDPGEPPAANCAERHQIRWFVPGQGRTTLVRIPGLPHVHLFGVDPPGVLFLLGTDALGRDILSRLLVGAQISLLAGLLGATLSIAAGVALGIIAGYTRTWADALISGAGEIFLALPWVYLLLAARAALPLTLPPADAFLIIIAILGLIGWARPARLVRSVVLAARTRDYVIAARGLGATASHIVRRHVLPDVAWVALTQATVLVPQYILGEVTLSFFGVGVAEPMPSWGSMLASALRPHAIVSSSWLLAPLVALILVCMMYYSLTLALREDSSSATEK